MVEIPEDWVICVGKEGDGPRIAMIVKAMLWQEGTDPSLDVVKAALTILVNMIRDHSSSLEEALEGVEAVTKDMENLLRGRENPLGDKNISFESEETKRKFS